MRAARFLSIGLGLLALSGGSAGAADGRREINQACALAATPCVADDAAGSFPVTITQAGSYLLTSDLVVPAGADGVLVVAGAAASATQRCARDAVARRRQLHR